MEYETGLNEKDILLMKKLILFISIILLASCSNDNNVGDVITSEFDRISILLPQGNWRVSTLFINDEDRSLDMEGYTFNFSEDGTVESEPETRSGTWYYQSTSKHGEQLIIENTESGVLGIISNTWSIISISTTKIKLSIDSENTENPNALVFSKIE